MWEDLREKEVSHVHSVEQDCCVEGCVAIVTLQQVDVLGEVGHHPLHTPAKAHTHTHIYIYDFEVYSGTPLIIIYWGRKLSY